MFGKMNIAICQWEQNLGCCWNTDTSSMGSVAKLDQSSVCCSFPRIGCDNCGPIDTTDVGRVHSPQCSMMSSVFLSHICEGT